MEGQGCPQPIMVTASNSHPLLSGQTLATKRGQLLGISLSLVGGWRRALVSKPGFSGHLASHVPFVCSWDRAESLPWIKEKLPSA